MQGTSAGNGQQEEKFRPAHAQFCRDDWMDFRDPNRISNKAGVKYEFLPKAVVKELVDDALDASGGVEFGLLDDVASDSVTFFVADAGPGLEGSDEEIAALYSIRRSLSSSKMLRRPTRGMLGNGLRVVAGVVLVAGGQLRVSTRGRTLTLKPQAEDGRTAIVGVEPWDGTGTRAEVTLRGDLARQAQSNDGGLFDWAEEANRLSGGTQHKGKSSSHWYDDAAFWELLQGAGDARVEVFAGRNLDGCSDKATEVVGDLCGRTCKNITRDEAAAILRRAQAATRPVVPERLGKVGRRDDYFGYSGCETGEFTVHGAKVPFVVEAWANRALGPGGAICVNRTPVCANVDVRRQEGADYAIFGCQLSHGFTAGRKDAGEFQVLVNVITPYVPLTSSSKDPDLSKLVKAILAALEKSIRVAKRTAPKVGKKHSQKNIVRTRIKTAAEKLSGNGKYLFSLRQLFYELRQYLIQALGREPMYGTFSRIVGKFEDEHGDIEHLYRDDRGSLYHPHTRETIPLGTRSVAAYNRPEFTFRSILFCEKEGLFPMLKHARWPEQFDCALCSSKGFATRAARALIRLLQKSPEPITVFVLHDADGPGTTIYDVLQRALETCGVEVINLGLDPAEAREMGLTVEPVKRKKNKRVPVADYIPDPDKEWLQKNRCEINAMTTPQLIERLTAKFTDHYKNGSPKVIPPAKVVTAQLEQETQAAIERRITDEVMKAANIPHRVQAEFNKVKRLVKETAKALARDLPQRLESTPVAHWSELVTMEASGIVFPAVFPDAGGKPVENASRKLDTRRKIPVVFPDAGMPAENRSKMQSRIRASR